MELTMLHVYLRSVPVKSSSLTWLFAEKVCKLFVSFELFFINIRGSRLSCVTAAARPLCLPWTTKTAVVAKQVAQRRQSGGKTIAKVAQGLPWSPANGATVVATVIAQWTLLVGQRRHNGGTRKAEASLKLIHNFTTVRIFLRGDQWPTTLHPFCDHGDVCALLLPPLSDLWATDLLGDLCATVLNMPKTSRRPWRPRRCLNVLCTNHERPRQPLGLLSAFNGDLASFVVAQRRHKGTQIYSW